MRVCLFEDSGHTNLEPLALTRPVFDLFCGLGTLAGKQCRYFAPCEVGMMVRPGLTGLARIGHPATPVNDSDWLRAEPTILINGRWLPPAGAAEEIPGPCVALVGDEVAYAVLGSERLLYCSANTIDDCLEIWKKTLPIRPAGGRMVRHLWELVQHNGEQICLDFEHNHAGRGGPLPETPLALLGPPERVLIDPTAQLDPLVVVDTRQGPVVIDRQATVQAFSRLEGPCYIGPETQVLGAKVRAGTTLGPGCRIGGEIEASIVQGQSNKYHDGFLGHSYVGEWVNLGAGTQTSDLRNDYGPVTVVVDGRSVATGLSKVGCFLGDHTKIGLGTLLNTGSNIGAFCNLLPSGTLLPKHVPSFSSWWKGALVEQADMSQLLRTAALVMERRGRALTDIHIGLYQSLLAQTASLRARVILEGRQRQLRRSA